MDPIGNKTRNSLLLTLVMCFCVIPVIAQKVNYGIGLSLQTNFFHHNDRAQFEGTFYKPALSYNFGVQGFLDIQTNSAFQARLLVNGHTRRIRFAIQVPGIKTTARDGAFSQFYSSFETKLYGRYLLEMDNLDILPKLGFFVGLHYSGGVGFSKSSGHSVYEALPPDVDPESANTFMNYGLLTGVSFRPHRLLFKRNFEIDVDLAFSPRDFLEYPIFIESAGQPIFVQGQYHYLSIAFNYYLRKPKNSL